MQVLLTHMHANTCSNCEALPCSGAGRVARADNSIAASALSQGQRKEGAWHRARAKRERSMALGGRKEAQDKGKERKEHSKGRKEHGKGRKERGTGQGQREE